MFWLWWDGIRQDTSAETRARRARWLIQTLLELGPVFIKVGQSLSTRVDLLPPEYLTALSALQDSVPPFSTREAVATIEQELGRSLKEVFAEFVEVPLAAASLGQVHRARLHTGEAVVVKVQRPGLRALFDLDSRAVNKLIRVLRKRFDWARKLDLLGIYDEFFTILYQEIDYSIEGKNADRFRENFRDYPQIATPKVFWECSTTKVLTLEYLPGIKVDDVAALRANGLSPRAVNDLGIRSYLKQFLVDGFFHADPHPGNLAVRSDGTLIFYDYGMMAEIPALDKEQMVQTFFAILKKDANEVVDRFVAMGLLVPSSDMSPVKRIVQFVLDRFTEKPFDVKAFVEVKDEVYLLFEKQPFRLPAKMTYLLKSMSTLVGIALILDPQYNFKAAAQPFVKTLALATGNTGAIAEFARQAKDFLVYKFRQPSATEVILRRLEERLERGELLIQVQSLESERTLKRIEMAVLCVLYGCLAGLGAIAGVLLVALSFSRPGFGLWAVVCGIGTVLSLLKLSQSVLVLSLRTQIDRLVSK
ncbi:MAG: AarF/ABC1/UbiB kinase family protein [Oscillatoriales cyanobacterium SM2_1_8]|nr:AarF/ABC1/UbiB kinase family protein [Oscillatoriales cyanobacterium SM2_1_8]